MKSKKVTVIALTVAITTSILSSNVLADTNGKTHEKYPDTQEMSELISVDKELL